MSEEERVKRFVVLKKRLEKRVEDLSSELKEMQTMLEAIDAVLLEKGFKRAKVAKATVTKEVQEQEAEAVAGPSPPTEYEEVIVLKTVTGELLANLYVQDDFLRVVLAEDKDFDVNTPPFTQFFLERILTKMQEKDSELTKTGQLDPERILSFNIVREGDIVRELSIKNLNVDRLREVKSSLRWTLEKMYEKMSVQD